MDVKVNVNVYSIKEEKLFMIMKCDNSIEYDIIHFNKFNEVYKVQKLRII